MSWVKLSDSFPEHPKLLRAGPIAGWLHVKALCYCNRHLTDGKLPRAAVAALVQQTCSRALTEGGKPISMRSLTRRLVSAGLWEKDGSGWIIHGYLEYQPSRRDTETRQRQIHDARVRAGAAGGQQTSSKRTSNVQQASSPVPSRPDPLILQQQPTCASEYARAVLDLWPTAGGTFYQAYFALEHEYGAEAALAALHEAQRSGKVRPTVNYLQAILDRCQQEGVLPGERQERNDGKPTEIDGQRVAYWRGDTPVFAVPTNG